jgi:hypothetical protein
MTAGYEKKPGNTTEIFPQRPENVATNRFLR